MSDIWSSVTPDDGIAAPIEPSKLAPPSQIKASTPSFTPSSSTPGQQPASGTISASQSPIISSFHTLTPSKLGHADIQDPPSPAINKTPKLNPSALSFVSKSPAGSVVGISSPKSGISTIRDGQVGSPKSTRSGGGFGGGYVPPAPAKREKLTPSELEEKMAKMKLVNAETQAAAESTPTIPAPLSVSSKPFQPSIKSDSIASTINDPASAKSKSKSKSMFRSVTSTPMVLPRVPGYFEPPRSVSVKITPTDNGSSISVASTSTVNVPSTVIHADGNNSLMLHYPSILSPMSNFTLAQTNPYIPIVVAPPSPPMPYRPYNTHAVASANAKILANANDTIERQRKRIETQTQMLDNMKRRETSAYETLARTSLDAAVKTKSLDMVTNILSNVIHAVSGPGQTNAAVKHITASLENVANLGDVTVPIARRISPPPAPIPSNDPPSAFVSSRFTELRDIDFGNQTHDGAVTTSITFRHAYNDIGKQAREADARSYADQMAKDEAEAKLKAKLQLEAVAAARERRTTEQARVDEERRIARELKISRLQQGSQDGSGDRWATGHTDELDSSKANGSSAAYSTTGIRNTHEGFASTVSSGAAAVHPSRAANVAQSSGWGGPAPPPPPAITATVESWQSRVVPIPSLDSWDSAPAKAFVKDKQDDWGSSSKAAANQAPAATSAGGPKADSWGYHGPQKSVVPAPAPQPQNPGGWNQGPAISYGNHPNSSNGLATNTTVNGEPTSGLTPSSDPAATPGAPGDFAAIPIIAEQRWDYADAKDCPAWGRMSKRTTPLIPRLRACDEEKRADDWFVYNKPPTTEIVYHSPEHKVVELFVSGELELDSPPDFDDGKVVPSRNDQTQWTGRLRGGSGWTRADGPPPAPTATNTLALGRPNRYASAASPAPPPSHQDQAWGAQAPAPTPTRAPAPPSQSWGPSAPSSAPPAAQVPPDDSWGAPTPSRPAPQSDQSWAAPPSSQAPPQSAQSWGASGPPPSRVPAPADQYWGASAPSQGAGQPSPSWDAPASTPYRAPAQQESSWGAPTPARDPAQQLGHGPPPPRPAPSSSDWIAPPDDNALGMSLHASRDLPPHLGDGGGGYGAGGGGGFGGGGSGFGGRPNSERTASNVIPITNSRWGSSNTAMPLPVRGEREPGTVSSWQTRTEVAPKDSTNHRAPPSSTTAPITSVNGNAGRDEWGGAPSRAAIDASTSSGHPHQESSAPIFTQAASRENGPASQAPAALILAQPAPPVVAISQLAAEDDWDAPPPKTIKSSSFRPPAEAERLQSSTIEGLPATHTPTMPQRGVPVGVNPARLAMIAQSGPTSVRALERPPSEENLIPGRPQDSGYGARSSTQPIAQPNFVSGAPSVSALPAQQGPRKVSGDIWSSVAPVDAGQAPAPPTISAVSNGYADRGLAVAKPQEDSWGGPPTQAQSHTTSYMRPVDTDDWNTPRSTAPLAAVPLPARPGFAPRDASVSGSFATTDNSLSGAGMASNTSFAGVPARSIPVPQTTRNAFEVAPGDIYSSIPSATPRPGMSAEMTSEMAVPSTPTPVRTAVPPAQRTNDDQDWSGPPKPAQRSSTIIAPMAPAPTAPAPVPVQAQPAITRATIVEAKPPPVAVEEADMDWSAPPPPIKSRMQAPSIITQASLPAPAQASSQDWNSNRTPIATKAPEQIPRPAPPMQQAVVTTPAPPTPTPARVEPPPIPTPAPADDDDWSSPPHPINRRLAAPSFTAAYNAVPSPQPNKRDDSDAATPRAKPMEIAPAPPAAPAASIRSRMEATVVATPSEVEKRVSTPAPAPVQAVETSAILISFDSPPEDKGSLPPVMMPTPSHNNSSYSNGNISAPKANLIDVVNGEEYSPIRPSSKIVNDLFARSNIHPDRSVSSSAFGAIGDRRGPVQGTSPYGNRSVSGMTTSSSTETMVNGTMSKAANASPSPSPAKWNPGSVQSELASVFGNAQQFQRALDLTEIAGMFESAPFNANL